MKRNLEVENVLETHVKFANTGVMSVRCYQIAQRLADASRSFFALERKLRDMNEDLSQDDALYLNKLESLRAIASFDLEQVIFVEEQNDRILEDYNLFLAEKSISSLEDEVFLLKSRIEIGKKNLLDYLRTEHLLKEIAKSHSFRMIDVSFEEEKANGTEVYVHFSDKIEFEKIVRNKDMSSYSTLFADSQADKYKILIEESNGMSRLEILQKLMLDRIVQNRK